MTTISSIYDQIYTILSSEFPNKKVLFNAYELSDNNEQVLKNAFGVAWEIGTDTQQIQKNILVIDREFIVNSVRVYYSTDLNKEPQKTVEKLLFEDQLTIIKALVSYVEKPGSSNHFVEDISFLDDNGIEFVMNDSQRYLALNSRFKITYSEKLY